MYGTFDGWLEYGVARGLVVDGIAEGDPNSVAALNRASDYIKYHYVANFRSKFNDTLPEVELATYEAATIEFNDPHFFERRLTPSDAKVLVAVESIRWEKISANRTDQLDQSALMPVSIKIENYLRPYMRFRNSTVLRTIGA